MQKTDIDWADATLNPFGWGCYGPGGTKENPKVCPYCYALTKAKRKLSKCELCNAFIPHTHFERLEQLQRSKKPLNIFMQSMGDMFGDWVTDQEIKHVFSVCEKADRHRYLFLTKNPYRYARLLLTGRLIIGENIWFGTTLTGKGKLPFNALDSKQNFISLEPLLEPVSDKFPYANIQWVIIGAETGNRKGKVIPKREWIESIVEQCKEANVPVFMKNSLRDIWDGELIQEYPW